MSAEVPTDDQQSTFYATENDIEYGLPPYSDQDTYPLTGPPAASETAITPRDQYYPAVPSGPSQTSQHTANVTVVYTQPRANTIIRPEKPNNYLTFSILTFLFCCWILGIRAIIYSLQVDSLYAAGRYREAVIASERAKIRNIISVVVGTILHLVVGVFIIIVIVS